MGRGEVAGGGGEVAGDCRGRPPHLRRALATLANVAEQLALGGEVEQLAGGALGDHHGAVGQERHVRRVAEQGRSLQIAPERAGVAQHRQLARLRAFDHEKNKGHVAPSGGAKARLPRWGAGRGLCRARVR